ncbi:MAG: putative glucose/L-sorbosone dehydrogenase, distantly related to bacterial beta-galactosidase [Schlesneria sp.]|nr:putative glucose/L-sorbosone dehydrogenase, distantly related to bacterial beta-galactosidase [Schlesneria sp.]
MFWKLLGLLSLVLVPQLGHAQDSANRKSEYREFAAANPGDAAAGKIVFEDATKAACAKCHSIDGSRRGVGPDLGSIGNKFERPGLIQSILDPSSSIAIGYGITIVVTESGQAYQGVLQRVTDEFLELKDKDSKTVRIEAGPSKNSAKVPHHLCPSGSKR